MKLKKTPVTMPVVSSALPLLLFAFLAVCPLAATLVQAQASDFPPRLAVRVPFAPTPVRGDDGVHLVYELHISNLDRRDVTLKRVHAEYVRLFDKQPQQMTSDELVQLFEDHCRDDGWREVLRLICGQIDEQFVGRIVEHLATRTDLEQWDGMKPLPELPLAIWCLSEVRSTSRIAEAGSKLLMTAVACFLRGESPSRQFVFELVAAAKDLGMRWPGKSAFKFSHQFPSSSAYYHHWQWPHFLTAVFEQRHWIVQLAHCDSWDVRRGSLEALAAKWPDETTRKLLAARAVQDEHPNSRSAALEALAGKWPDETTRKLLAERAVQDESLTKDQQAEYGVVLGKMHSEFGHIVFTRDLDGRSAYLDLRKPIPRGHIQKAAKKADIAADKIDETLRSLSEHMGWDITEGIAYG